MERKERQKRELMTNALEILKKRKLIKRKIQEVNNKRKNRKERRGKRYRVTMHKSMKRKK